MQEIESIIRYVLSDFWRWLGFVILLAVLRGDIQKLYLWTYKLIREPFSGRKS